MSQFVLAVENVSHTYTTTDGQVVKALHEVTLCLSPKTFTCLVGASGSGKTTLLRIMAGLIRPKSGQVLLNGKPLRQPQRRISLVFQRDTLLPWRTVRQNVALPLQLAGVDRKKRFMQADQLLDLMGLSEFANAFPTELSGGMIQRVNIARGLITQPDILLLDEPFGALDALTREQLWRELLLIWGRTHATVLMVTHDIREAIFLSQRVMVMSTRPGHIVKEVEVPFDYPRHFDLLTDPIFIQKEAQVREAILADRLSSSRLG
ncbi:MAG: hypothetical protein CUN55_05815 [Phototrophicales bacterium]|nr:MAG: hypothetical protein CUN55_05815 [Phototrophicales bacterium]